ncbi:MAG: type II CAAX endopeptidase family protein [Acidobacteriia bacterium]|nr:type II CAAX endopeptidase family protein [Terriglobia bacterium]
MKLPVSLRAVVYGILVGLIAANVWPLLLRTLGIGLGAAAEAVFLGLYIWWASGGGPPENGRTRRRAFFRNTSLTPRQWLWGLVAALSFAVAVHSAIVLLFRFVPFPAEEFRRGYDFSFIPTQALRWMAVMVSAASAGICEETGFRGYMQQPIEQHHGPSTAILVSSFFFLAFHLTKSWALIGVLPIVFGAGVLLGLLAWSSGSLIPGIIGHFVMDVGLFAYWWTGIAGTFAELPVKKTGIDGAFLIAGAVFAVALTLVFMSARNLKRMRVQPVTAM